MLGTADNHLWGSIEASKPQLAGDAIRQFAEVCQKAREGDRILLLPGDLFNQSAKIGITEYRAQAERCTEGLEVYFTQGNHDHAGSTEAGPCPPWLPVTGRFHWIGADASQVTMIGDLKVGGIDYQRGRTLFLEQWEKLPEDLDIVLIHQAHRHFLPYDGAWEICDEDILAKRPKLVICGHVHAPLLRKVGESWFCSPGSTVVTTFAAPYKRNVPGISEYNGRLTYLDLAEGVSKPVLREFQGRRYLKVDLALAPVDELAKRLDEARALSPVEQPYIVVEYEPTPGALNTVRQLFDGLPFSGKPRMTAEDEDELEAVKTDASAAEIIARHVDQVEAPELFALLMDIMHLDTTAPEALSRVIDSHLARLDAPALPEPEPAEVLHSPEPAEAIEEKSE